MRWDSLKESLPPAVKSTGQNASSQLEKQKQLAPVLFRELLERNERDPIALKAICDGLPDSVMNNIGTVTGKGINSKGGMGLHKDSKGHILRCRDNVLLTGDYLSEDELQKIFDEQGWAENDFGTFIGQMKS